MGKFNYDEFIKKYINEHYACPKCGSELCKSTLVGYVVNVDDLENYKDLNICECSICHDKHTAHERIPRSLMRLSYVGGNPINEEIYLILEEADIESCGKVSKYLNDNGSASITVCPKCGVDDFMHVSGCELNRFF